MDYKYFCSFNAGTVFLRQNMTYTDVKYKDGPRAETVNNSPVFWIWNVIIPHHLQNNLNQMKQNFSNLKLRIRPVSQPEKFISLTQHLED